MASGGRLFDMRLLLALGCIVLCLGKSHDHGLQVVHADSMPGISQVERTPLNLSASWLERVTRAFLGLLRG